MNIAKKLTTDRLNAEIDNDNNSTSRTIRRLAVAIQTANFNGLTWNGTHYIRSHTSVEV
jgi:hypothetical protein